MYVNFERVKILKQSLSVIAVAKTISFTSHINVTLFVHPSNYDIIHNPTSLLPGSLHGHVSWADPPCLSYRVNGTAFLTLKPNQGLHVSAPPAAAPCVSMGPLLFFFVYVQYVTVPMSGNSSASTANRPKIISPFCWIFGKKKHTVEPPFSFKC